MKKILLAALLVILSLVVFYYMSNSEKKVEVKENAENIEHQQDSSSLIYGFHPDSFYIFQGQIQPNEFLADLLLPVKVSYETIHFLAKNAKKVFDVRNLRAGGNYTIICKDSCTSADFFIYENSPYQYVIYDLQNTSAEIVERKIDKKIKTAAGSVNGSLWLSMEENDFPVELIYKMEKALAWSVDFYHIQPRDSFRLVYEEDIVDSEVIGTGRLLAAYFNNNDKEYYSIWYENGKYKGYYDECGRPMKGAFLKAPVEYSRISSRYNPRRFHPVLKRVRPHLGTDYAAPHGTPIRAVADGRVIRASYSSGNGRYVKIKHDKVYSTQYLHMSRFGPGIKKGVHVKQGQTIGYVGSTGLATGPHVCFRFWKNGRQVDHQKEYLPPPDPMDKADLPYYFEHRDEVLRLLGTELVPEYLAENENTSDHSSENSSSLKSSESR